MQALQTGIMLCALGLALTACTKTPTPAQSETEAPPAQAAAAADEPAPDVGQPEIAVPEMPIVPAIVVPPLLGVSPAQRALEGAMAEVLDPVAGITVSPARCGADGALLDTAVTTHPDALGAVARNTEAGLFRIEADGSSSANFEGGLITVNADGSGTINGVAEPDGSEAILRVEADGSGSYNGKSGLIRLDGQGGGTWNGEHGLIVSHGDGSGSWNGPQGLVRVEADGSGTWNGPHGLIVNHGDGTGTIGPPARPVRMPPMPPVPPAGRFPPLQALVPPGAACGYVVTLDDRVLFDFDKSDIRPDAAHTLDVFAEALRGVASAELDIRGHTDSKGTPAYNQPLSERRARAVLDALQARGVTHRASAHGLGESQPVAPNSIGGRDNPAGRQRNRRVEVFVRA